MARVGGLIFRPNEKIEIQYAWGLGVETNPSRVPCSFESFIASHWKYDPKYDDIWWFIDSNLMSLGG